MRHHHLDAVWVVLAGVVSSLSLSGLETGWLAWVALVPSFVVLGRVSFLRGFLLGCLAGAVQVVVMWKWIVSATHLLVGSMALGVVFLAVVVVAGAVHFGLLYGATSFFMRGLGFGVARWRGTWAVLAIGCLWIVFEYANSVLIAKASLAFPLLIGYSQWHFPVVLQIASVTGIYGVSFLIVAVNAGLAHMLVMRDKATGASRIAHRFVPIVVAVSITLSCVLFGAVRLHLADRGSGHGRTIRVAVLQGNISGFDKFNREKSNALAQRYIELGEQANRTKPDIIVWTEAAIPWTLEEDDDLMNTMMNITQPSGACHILGGTMRSSQDTNRFHNTAFLILADGTIVQKYDKRYLLSFVESDVSVPFFSSHAKTLHPDTRMYVGGSEPPRLDTPVGRAGVLICNENLYSEAARECSRYGVDFMVHLANDVWFMGSSAVRQHFAIAVARTVEMGRDTVIANNPGISAVVDRCGRVRVRSESQTHVCLLGLVTPDRRGTVYSREGDWFALGCVFVSLAGALGCLVTHRGKGRDASRSADVRSVEKRP